MLTYRNWITRQMLKDSPDTLFVFGDNMARWGLGGQAKEMRGELNAVGIPTKVDPKIFLKDSDLPAWLVETLPDVERLMKHSGEIIWPSSGIGTGLANLEYNSPIIFTIIRELEAFLKRRKQQKG